MRKGCWWSEVDLAVMSFLKFGSEMGDSAGGRMSLIVTVQN